MLRVAFPEPLWYQDLNLLSQDLLPGVAEQLFNLGVDQDDFSLQVHYYHGVGCCLQKAAELGLRLLPVSHVSGDFGETH